MQKYAAVLALTLMTAAPVFAAVTTDQSATTPSTSRTAQTPRATTPPPAQAVTPGQPASDAFASSAFVPSAPQAAPTVAATQQTPAPPAMAAPVAPASAPRPPTLPNGAMAVNIRLDLVLTDNFGGTPTKKTVSMVVMNRQSGMIRTQNHVGGFQVRLDVDAAIEQHATGGTNVAPIGGGPLTLRLTLQYTPAPTDAGRGTGPGNIPAGLNESLAVILQDGKPLLISQSADPVSDRRVTVEVTATVLK
jgi:hypothetical protein